MLLAGIILALILGGELCGYVFLLPDPSWQERSPNLLLRYMGSLAYGISYLLSLARAPLGLVPYLVKLFIFFGLRMRYEARHTSYLRELLNMFGDALNLVLSVLIVWWLVGPPRWQWWWVLWYLPVLAECVRLAAERIPTIFSAAWQLMPHRVLARHLQERARSHWAWWLLWHGFARYCRYYTLSDRARAAYVLQVLKQQAAGDPAVVHVLSYVHAFRIVEQKYALRGGIVRDVARGEIFIHAIWTADPWLLIGMALRRSAWVFDPRCVRRPFYYMSGANRLTSLFILRHAHYSWPYAIFQFGHEIRVARLHCFYVLLRWFGFDVERKISADGSFHNDQAIFWLKRHFEDPTLTMPHSLYTDEEVMLELLSQDVDATLPSALDIAVAYTYPLCYVEEVLLPHLRRTVAVLASSDTL
ncbi:MAG TPA: hypothetical protein VHZ51_26000 [Ktedonobacteraceae bacterium]|jgi:hypothetical protein|nr:hypothetical protein [Ktedonobacteraceae bacterium]